MKPKVSLEERIRQLIEEPVVIVPYDPGWPEKFRLEKEHLQNSLPADLIRRIEHFGSTAVPDLAAKPVIDLLIEVADLEETQKRIVPVLTGQGYEYFWRPTKGDDGPPFYAWFIKRDPKSGERTHHLHMVEADFTEHWDRLLFRDYLIAHPETAQEYGILKENVAKKHPRDRVAYTQARTEFIERITDLARREN